MGKDLFLNFCGQLRELKLGGGLLLTRGVEVVNHTPHRSDKACDWSREQTKEAHLGKPIVVKSFVVSNFDYLKVW
jgi:hypothetical protein